MQHEYASTVRTEIDRRIRDAVRVGNHQRDLEKYHQNLPLDNHRAPRNALGALAESRGELVGNQCEYGNGGSHHQGDGCWGVCFCVVASHAFVALDEIAVRTEPAERATVVFGTIVERVRTANAQLASWALFDFTRFPTGSPISMLEWQRANAAHEPAACCSREALLALGLTNHRISHVQCCNGIPRLAAGVHAIRRVASPRGVARAEPAITGVVIAETRHESHAVLVSNICNPDPRRAQTGGRTTIVAVQHRGSKSNIIVGNCRPTKMGQLKGNVPDPAGCSTFLESILGTNGAVEKSMLLSASSKRAIGRELVSFMNPAKGTC